MGNKQPIEQPIENERTRSDPNMAEFTDVNGHRRALISINHPLYANMFSVATLKINEDTRLTSNISTYKDYDLCSVKKLLFEVCHSKENTIGDYKTSECVNPHTRDRIFNIFRKQNEVNLRMSIAHTATLADDVFGSKV